MDGKCGENKTTYRLLSKNAIKDEKNPKRQLGKDNDTRYNTRIPLKQNYLVLCHLSAVTIIASVYINLRWSQHKNISCTCFLRALTAKQNAKTYLVYFV